MRGRQLKSRKNAVSINTAVQQFLIHCSAKGLAPLTQKTYTYYLNDFIDYMGENATLDDITSMRLSEYVLYKKDVDGIKDVTAATYMRHIRTFVKFCSANDLMSPLSVSVPRFEKRIKDPYTDEELTLLLARPTSDNWTEFRNWCMISYFVGTGQRLSTVLNVRVKDLNLDKGLVKLEWNKDKIQKFAPLSPTLVRILREYIERSDLHPEDPLFPEYEGKPLSTRAAQSAIALYNHSRGVEKSSVHLFRHTFAKNYILNGGSPAKLQKILGHKDISTTMIYVNLFSNDLADGFEDVCPLDTICNMQS